MISLTSLAFSLVASLAQQAPAPPALIRAPVPPPITTRPLSPQAKARQVKWEGCRRAFYGQTYLPQPPIYRLSDSDTTLYLLGSIHSLPPAFDWRPAELAAIVAGADRLITENGTETLPDTPNPIAILLGQETPTAAPSASPSNRPPLRERLDGERRAKWLGMSTVGPRYLMDWLDRQPDWRVAMTVFGFSTRLNDIPMSSGVEAQLRREFQAAKKPIEQLEASKDVMGRFNALPPAVQRRMLDQSFDLVGGPSRSGDYMAMMHNWARGQAVVEPLEASLPSELRDVILDQRNAAWVPVIRKHLEAPGTRLVVVGAGHLTGRNNLIELLAAAGMKPERFSRTGSPLPREPFTPQPKRLADCTAYLGVPPAPPPPPRPK